MELAGPWEAVVADDDLRRTWLDDGLVVPTGGTEARTDHTDDDAHRDDAEAGGPDWRPVTVPGHWQDDEGFSASDGPLLYRTRFEHPGPAGDERWWLCFDGVFYQGDVWLDGGYVGDTEGYFFPHTFEVTDALAERTEHTLGIEVTCGRPSDRSQKRSITGSLQHSAYLDPNRNPGGIWRPVRLERTGPVRIRHLRVLCREANETRAQVSFRAVLDASAGGEVTLRSTVGDTEFVEVRRLAAGENQVEWRMRIDDPQLWWPHALGEPVLHDVVVEVTPAGPADTATTADTADTAHTAEGADQVATDGVETGERSGPAPEPSHRLHRRIGLRQVHLRGWVLHVNGERLFLKGASLAPTAADLAAATPDEVAADVRLARDAGLDLLRVHAHIARPELYEAADELGMVLWQDFPLHGGYARTIRKQAQRQAREAVDLLGHHPCIALWCAHDAPFDTEDLPGEEAGRSMFPARFLAAQELPSWNKTILDRSVKRAIDKADGSRPVIAHSGVLPHPPQLDGTDSHLWFGWLHGEARDLAPFARAFPRLVRFVGQFGAQAVPETADFMEPERWPDLEWDRLGSHHGLQREVFERRVPPGDHPTFSSWRSATQAYQADVVAQQVETLRRLKYRPTGGFALFHLADAQPAVSSSLLDHRRQAKAGFAALAEACRPVIVTTDRLPARVDAGQTLALDVHVVSDLRTPVDDLVVNATLSWPGGEQRWRFGGTIPADSCQRVGTLQIEVPDRPGPMSLVVELRGDDLPDGPVRRVDRTRIVR